MKKTIVLFLFALLLATGGKAAESLPELHISFPASSLPDDEYIQGNMTLQSEEYGLIELPARFRTRGATAKHYRMKPSFNMKLETEEGEELDTDLLGLRTASSWILDAMAIDRICMRNRVCFDIWNSYYRLPYSTDFDGRDGTVGKFVIVYINDQYKGIYCLSDKINRKLLNLKKPKVDGDDVTIRGVLYKNGTTDILNQENVGFYNDYMVYVAQWHDAWELQEPDDYPCEEAWQPLVEFYQNLNSSYAKEKFYEDNIIDYTLLISALCITDNWGNKNKYFSMKNIEGDPNEQMFIVTPWDLDTSLGGEYDGSYFGGNYSQWTMSQIGNSALLPFSLCFSDAAYKEKMAQRWGELRNSALSLETVSGLLYGYCNLFEETGAWQQYVDFWNTQSSKPCYVENLRAEIDLIVDWYSARISMMDEYFGIAGVESMVKENSPAKIFNLQGIPMDENKLMPGQIYIENGRKFVK